MVGHDGTFLQVCCTSPLVVLARATPSGLVELLALETQIGPFASAPTVSASAVAKKGWWKGMWI